MKLAFLFFHDAGERGELGWKRSTASTVAVSRRSEKMSPEPTRVSSAAWGLHCQIPAFGTMLLPASPSNKYSSCRDQMAESPLAALSTPRVHTKARYVLISISPRRCLTAVAVVRALSASISHCNVLYTEPPLEALRGGYVASICKTVHFAIASLFEGISWERTTLLWTAAADVGCWEVREVLLLTRAEKKMA